MTSRIYLSAVALLLLVLTRAVFAESASRMPVERVLITGDAGPPRDIAYSRELTVTRAIIRGGGYADFGGRPIFLVRGGQVSRIDMRVILAQPSEDTALKPWDIIVIGKSLAPGR